jgi:hypothetical protein
MGKLLRGENDRPVRLAKRIPVLGEFLLDDLFTVRLNRRPMRRALARLILKRSDILWCRSPGIDYMKESENGVPQQHARPSVTHHPFDFVPHTWLITVNGAFGAHRFLALEPTPFQPGRSVIQQGAALPAPWAVTSMLPPAIAGDHGRDRLSFS